jgi:putative hydrolase of the HAD superfamily
MIKAVIFDWGGVMTMGADPGKLTTDMADLLQVDRDSISQLWKEELGKLLRGQLSDHEFWQAVAHKFDVTVPKDTVEVWAGWDDLKPEPEMFEFVHHIKQQGLKVAVLSNLFPAAEVTIKSHGGFDEFDAVILSCQEGYAKPEHELYAKAVSALGVEASECIFIDDRMAVLTPAWAMGMTTILGVTADQIIRDVTQALQAAAQLG